MRIRAKGVVDSTPLNPNGIGTLHVKRTPEAKEATRLRKLAERKAHRARVWAKYPSLVRYAKKKFKPGTKSGKKRGKTQLPHLGLQ